AGGGLEDLDGAVGDHVRGVAMVTLAEQLLAGLEVDVGGVAADPPEVVLGQPVEQRHPAQSLVRIAHIEARYSWTSEMHMEPCPTADATRRMAPSRTSPAANTP